MQGDQLIVIDHVLTGELMDTLLGHGADSHEGIHQLVHRAHCAPEQQQRPRLGNQLLQSLRRIQKQKTDLDICEKGECWEIIFKELFKNEC